MSSHQCRGRDDEVDDGVAAARQLAVADDERAPARRSRRMPDVDRPSAPSAARMPSPSQAQFPYHGAPASTRTSVVARGERVRHPELGRAGESTSAVVVVEAAQAADVRGRGRRPARQAGVGEVRRTCRRSVEVVAVNGGSGGGP